jgi:hypothetical protein
VALRRVSSSGIQQNADGNRPRYTSSHGVWRNWFKRGYGALNSTNGRNGKSASARGVHSYVMPAFGDRLGEVRLVPVA